MIAQTNAPDESVPVEGPDGDRLHQPRSIRGDLICKWTVAAVLLLGILLRVSQYLRQRSLWLDEGSLALNFLERGYEKLLRPFPNHQSAPLGFNALTEATIQVAGISELSLRFFPFLAGVASVLVFWQVSRRWLNGWALVFANYAFAISSSLIYYSNEFKPYGIDVLFTLVLLWAIEAWMDSGWSRKGALWLALLGGVAVWFSFPAVFVLAGVGGAALLKCCHDRDPVRFGRLASMIAVWVVSFGCQYALHGRHIAQMTDLTEYWRAESAFMPFPPWRGVTWFTSSFFGYFHDVAGLHNSRNIWQFIFLCGIAALIKRREFTRLTMLLGPIAWALFASAAEHYPFQGRLILFTVPLAFLLCGEGIALLLDGLTRHKVVAVLLAAVAFFSPTAYSLPQLRRTVKVEEVRPIAEYLKEKAGAEDVVFLFKDHAPYLVYQHLLGLPQEKIGFFSEQMESTLPRVAKELQSGRRCWLIISHVTESERAAVLSAFDQEYNLEPVVSEIGAELLQIQQ